MLSKANIFFQQPELKSNHWVSEVLLAECEMWGLS